MLTTMDTLDSASLSHASPTKAGEAEEVEALPPPVPAEQGHLTSSFLLASLPSRLGALWTSAEPGEALWTVLLWTTCSGRSLKQHQPIVLYISTDMLYSPPLSAQEQLQQS